MPVPANSGKRIIKITALHLKKSVTFPSLITQFEDTWTPQWKPEFVYGRMDPISFYGGTDRKLLLGFRVISEDLDEAHENMGAIQQLIRYQYPTYVSRASISTIKAPPYFEVEFYNVTEAGSTHVQGYFNGPLTINPGFQDKTKTQYFGENFTKILFSDVEIRLQMVVLHTKRVGYYNNTFGAQGDIAYPYNIGGVAQTQKSTETAPAAAPTSPPGPLPKPAAVATATTTAVAATPTPTTATPTSARVPGSTSTATFANVPRAKELAADNAVLGPALDDPGGYRPVQHYKGLPAGATGYGSIYGFGSIDTKLGFTIAPGTKTTPPGGADVQKVKTYEKKKKKSP
jgi:hypothetical protein